MAQVDRVRGLVGTLGVKAPCRMATTTNITLSGLQTIDGVAGVAEDRVLVQNQTTASENGLYNMQASNWVRTPDFDGNLDILEGTRVGVSLGTQAGLWRLTTANPVIDTSALVFILDAAQNANGVWPVTAGGTGRSALAQTLIFSDPQTWNTALGAMAVLTLTSNTTFSAPTNIRFGESYTLVVNQDAIGSRLITWDSVFKWAGGTPPTLSTDANAKDVLSLISDGTFLYGVIQKAFA